MTGPEHLTVWIREEFKRNFKFQMPSIDPEKMIAAGVQGIRDAILHGDPLAKAKEAVGAAETVAAKGIATVSNVIRGRF